MYSFITTVGQNGFSADVAFLIDADGEFVFVARDASGAELTLDEIATRAGVSREDVDALFALRAEEETREYDGDDRVFENDDLFSPLQLSEMDLY